MTPAVPAPQAPTAADMQLFADLYSRLPWMFPGMDPRTRVTVGQVIDAYMPVAEAELGRHTFENRAYYIESFREAFATRAVGELTPLDLREWLTENLARWPAGWTQATANTAVQRLFNFGVEMRIIRENPIRGARHRRNKANGRDMKPDEFQALLRHSDPYFRRYLVAMKLTGARPSELAALRFADIDFERGVATLLQHKTAAKTGLPRKIWLVPQLVKMIAIIKRDQHGSAADELRRMLSESPGRMMRGKEIVRRMMLLGYSHRAIWAARQVAGVIRRRPSPDGVFFYELPEDPDGRTMADQERVFVCSKQRPFNRTTLGTKFARLRVRIGLPVDCKLYSIRHWFITDALKRGVPMKSLATLVGHKGVAMIDKIYAHVDGDYLHLQQVARAACGLRSDPTPLPPPSDVPAWGRMMASRYPAAPVRVHSKRKPDPRRPLTDAEKTAWQAYQFAAKEAPELKADFSIYEWLIGRREFAGQLPPSGCTFRRYLHRARVHYHGVAKRKLRRVTANGKGATP